jgi:hypothetical protein
MKQLILSKQCPPIYQKLHERFGVNWDDGLIIADDYSLYCKYDIPPTKIVHELVHCAQQDKMGKDLWWELYLNKDSFRLEQEVEAFKREYKFVCECIIDRNARFEMLYDLAQILSSPQYGKLCTGDEAMRLIQS